MVAEEMLKAIGNRLRAMREALQLNQTELCAIAGFATNTYNQWERGHGRPDLDNALRLCEKFPVTMDWIYRGDAEHLPHGIAQRIQARLIAIEQEGDIAPPRRGRPPRRPAPST
jgi:transcriptional regulator with XRE-family HTH domain